MGAKGSRVPKLPADLPSCITIAVACLLSVQPCLFCTDCTALSGAVCIHEYLGGQVMNGPKTEPSLHPSMCCSALRLPNSTPTNLLRQNKAAQALINLVQPKC